MSNKHLTVIKSEVNEDKNCFKMAEPQLLLSREDMMICERYVIEQF